MHTGTALDRADKGGTRAEATNSAPLFHGGRFRGTLAVGSIFFREDIMRAILFLALSVFLSATAASADCTPVHFQQGAYVAQADGVAYYGKRPCYSLEVRPGQASRFYIAHGQNVYFDIPGVGSQLTDVQFYTTTYLIEVYYYQLAPGTGGQPFRIVFEIV